MGRSTKLKTVIVLFDRLRASHPSLLDQNNTSYQMEGVKEWYPGPTHLLPGVPCDATGAVVILVHQRFLQTQIVPLRWQKIVS